jgi:hypothetical protein
LLVRVHCRVLSFVRPIDTERLVFCRLTDESDDDDDDDDDEDTRTAQSQSPVVCDREQAVRKALAR